MIDHIFDFISFLRNQISTDITDLLLKYNPIFKIYNYGINDNKKIFSKPKIYENFITDRECKHILKTAENKYENSSLGGSSISKSNINLNIRSSSVCFLPKNDEIIKKIILRVCKLTKTNFENVEDLQVVKYHKNGFYKPHYDSDIKKKSEDISFRVLTFLLYLNDDYIGGQTKFPKLNFTVQPKKNSALLFHNLDDSKQYFNEYSLHGGLPIKEGIKYVANIWIHDVELDS